MGASLTVVPAEHPRAQQPAPAGAMAVGIAASASAAPERALALPVPARRPLGAAEVVRAALTEGLAMRAAVDNLGLQAQQLATVNRRAFLPKVGTSVGFQRQALAGTGLPSTGEHTAQAVVNVAWQMRTGGVVTVTRALDIGGAAAMSRQGSGSGVISISQPLLRGFGPAVAEAGLIAAESGFRLAVKDARATAASIVSRALAAYVDVQTAQAAAAEAREALRLALRQHEINQVLVDAGRRARIVRLQSE
jgi:outer membrane protein TolC